ncbi:MAG: hypothetical protein JSV00_01615 [bacterium]|nr:MAG: hypothetical protein JSV00_01615 [bacterium]
MAYKIAGVHDFEGPFISCYSLREESGVYVVLDLRADGYHMVDAGESGSVRQAVEGHGGKACWEENRRGTLHYAAWYGDEAARVKMLEVVTGSCEIPCLR